MSNRSDAAQPMHPFLDPASLPDLITNWGYLGIFVFIFLGNVGLPVPEETVLLAAGFFAGRELLSLEAIWALVVASAVAGDCCGYLVGRTGGQRLLERLASKFRSMRGRLDQLRTFFDQHGSKAVFMARFIAGARFMAGPMAGAAGMPFLRFLGWNVMGALVWCSLVLAIGYLLGDEVWHVITLVHRSVRWAAVGVLIIAVAASLVWWWTRQSARGSDAEA